jgi:hypothetical protein
MARPEPVRPTRCLKATNRFAECRGYAVHDLGLLKGALTTLLNLQNLLNAIGANRMTNVFYFDPVIALIFPIMRHGGIRLRVFQSSLPSNTSDLCVLH